MYDDSGCMEKMTDREMEVLQLVAEGCSNKRIADELGIAIRTVKFHTTNIYTKLECSLVWCRSGSVYYLLSGGCKCR